MKTHLTRQAPLAAGIGLALGILALGILAALGVRSLVARTASAEPAAPNPGHSWSQIGDLPGTMWHSNNDGAGSGLDSDTVDGLQSTQIQDADDYVSNAGYASTAASASSASYAASAGNSDTLDGQHASAFASASHTHPSSICTWSGVTFSTGAQCRQRITCITTEDVWVYTCGSDGAWSAEFRCCCGSFQSCPG
jgi:hypothetical protein